MASALPVPTSAVAELRRARRRSRVAQVDWVDALYHVYLAALAGGVAVIAVSTAVGDERVRGAALADVRAHGPAMAGVVAALAVAVGVRSGSRGGPLALERAEVRHVLLAPVDRGAALRGPAWRQLRFALFAATIVGAAAGQFAHHRLPGETLAWIGTGALAGATTVALALGSALAAAGQRCPRPLATLLAAGIGGWAVADATVDGVPASPARAFGHLVLWPFGFEAAGLAAVATAALLVGIGLAGLAGLRLDEAERRTGLVGQIRFAATLQDLRTVLVLRRQLAADLPRARPWLPVGRRPARFPGWRRGWRGILRWPLGRVARLVLLGVVAACCLRAVWAGTTPLVVGAGLALWLAALDAVEPLGQEVDHPGRFETYPRPVGLVLWALLAPAVVVMLVVGALSGAVAGLVGASTGGDAWPAAALLTGLVAGVTATAGAAVSVVSGVPDPADQSVIASPEIAGTKTVLRTAVPPALASVGTLPVVVARTAAERGEDALAAAAPVWVAALGVAGLGFGWVRVRDDVRRWLRDASEQATAGAAGRAEGRAR